MIALLFIFFKADPTWKEMNNWALGPICQESLILQDALLISVFENTVTTVFIIIIIIIIITIIILSLGWEAYWSNLANDKKHLVRIFCTNCVHLLPPSVFFQRRPFQRNSEFHLNKFVQMLNQDRSNVEWKMYSSALKQYEVEERWSWSRKANASVATQSFRATSFISETVRNMPLGVISPRPLLVIFSCRWLENEGGCFEEDVNSNAADDPG